MQMPIIVNWKRWALAKPEIGTVLPPLLLHICFLAQSASSSAPVVEAVSALSWVNQTAVVEDTTLLNTPLNCSSSHCCSQKKVGLRYH